MTTARCELTEAEIARFKPIQKVDPGMLAAVAEFRRDGRPPADSPKVRIGLRLAPDVVHGIPASGRGLQMRALSSFDEGKVNLDSILPNDPHFELRRY